MFTQSKLVRAVISPFMLWVAIIAVGSYFMFSFDSKILKEPATPGFIGSITKYYKALKLTYIKKGIDLAGGTYLVLGVELDKAVENRLNIESKSLDQLFKTRELKVLPVSKSVKGNVLTLAFENEEGSRACYNVLAEAKAASLQAKLVDNEIQATLTSELEHRIRASAVDQAVSVLGNRLDSTGVAGMVVTQHGDHQVVVQMPGVSDPERIKSLISRAAHLEFKMVEKSAGTREALLEAYDGELPSDKVIVPAKSEIDENGLEEAHLYYLVSAFPDMTGDRMVDAFVTRDEFGKPIVGFKLDGVGAREFGELTSNNVGHQVGIIMDDVMVSAPNISCPITGGSGTITGHFTQKEALDLSIVLKSGSLVAPLKFEQESRVGASLGQDSIYKGLMSCLIAMILLFLFSFIYYKIPGLFAVLALLLNFFLVMLFLSYFHGTLSLSGIAGMVLSVGMAIDASILIYEHIKDQLALGSTLRKAVNDGFSGALAVILDSNITTFLTGMVLFYWGGPAVRNFATTLMLGIVATLLSGILFLKAMFHFVFDVFEVKSMKF
jgi:preprotein translocase subunit SecD